MDARRNMYLEIYATRTPSYHDHPASRLPGFAVALALVAGSVALLSPETASYLTSLAADALAGLR